MDEIFYEYKEQSAQNNLSSNISMEIILHFLGKISENMVLFETKQTIEKETNSKIDEEAISTLQSIFNKVDPNLSLVKGKIREIFLSYSS